MAVLDDGSHSQDPQFGYTSIVTQYTQFAHNVQMYSMRHNDSHSRVGEREQVTRKKVCNCVGIAHVFMRLARSGYLPRTAVGKLKNTVT